MSLYTASVVLLALGALALTPLAAERSTPTDELRALDGRWVFVEDRTEGRAVEQQQPSMGSEVALRVEADALVLVRSDGDVRMALDGSLTEVVRERGTSRYRGRWQGGAFTYEVELLRAPDNTRTARMQAELRPTAEGLLARVTVDPPDGANSLALYRHPQDIALPPPATAAIGDLAWLAGAWVGSRGPGASVSLEERWSPPLGGAMLAVSRTVSRGRMTAFEYLRIVERDGGLVYVAQPNGGAPTEFLLVERGPGRAVFENPRHDFPQRIVYEVTADGGLVASIGHAKGGQPRRFEFVPEGAPAPGTTK